PSYSLEPTTRTFADGLVAVWTKLKKSSIKPWRRGAATWTTSSASAVRSNDISRRQEARTHESEGSLRRRCRRSSLGSRLGESAAEFGSPWKTPSFSQLARVSPSIISPQSPRYDAFHTARNGTRRAKVPQTTLGGSASGNSRRFSVQGMSPRRGRRRQEQLGGALCPQSVHGAILPVDWGPDAKEGDPGWDARGRRERGPSHLGRDGGKDVGGLAEGCILWRQPGHPRSRGSLASRHDRGAAGLD